MGNYLSFKQGNVESWEKLLLLWKREQQLSKERTVTNRYLLQPGMWSPLQDQAGCSFGRRSTAGNCLKTQPYKRVRTGEEEEKTGAYSRYSFPLWRAACDDLHSSAWGHAGPWPAVPVTQVTSMGLGTHGSCPGRITGKCQFWVWGGGDWGQVRSNQQWGGALLMCASITKGFLKYF